MFWGYKRKQSELFVTFELFPPFNFHLYHVIVLFRKQVVRKRCDFPKFAVALGYKGVLEN